MTQLPLGKIASSAALIQDGKLLLLKRVASASLFPNHWTFPSGGIEETDPSISAAVIREVKEETNLDFVPREKFGFFESIVNGKRYIALVHLGEWSGTIHLQPEEIAEYKFFTFGEIESLDLAFAYREVINDLHNKGLIQ